jgi:hypothetical protein
MMHHEVGTRVIRRSGTKTKCFRYGGKKDKNKGVKARYPRHPKECGCKRCRKRRDRGVLYPQIY